MVERFNSLSQVLEYAVRVARFKDVDEDVVRRLEEVKRDLEV